MEGVIVEKDYSSFSVKFIDYLWYITDGCGNFIDGDGCVGISMCNARWGVGEVAEEFLAKLIKEQSETKIYKTKPIDYTGCDPVIAEHLKRGESVLCDCGGVEGQYVIGYDGNDDHPYILSGSCSRCSANPTEQTQYVKKASEIVKWLEDNGYWVDRHGNWSTEEVAFFGSMFVYCGKEKPENSYTWLPEWIEYKEKP